MKDCVEIQELLALGGRLSDHQSHHVTECPSCAAVAAQWLVLDSVFQGDGGTDVPDGFADAVMKRVESEDTAPTGWLDRRWVQVALANAAALVTMANVVRFVARLLVPVTSLGGTP